MLGTVKVCGIEKGGGEEVGFEEGGGGDGWGVAGGCRDGYRRDGFFGMLEFGGGCWFRLVILIRIRMVADLDFDFHLGKNVP